MADFFTVLTVPNLDALRAIGTESAPTNSPELRDKRWYFVADASISGTGGDAPGFYCYRLDDLRPESLRKVIEHANGGAFSLPIGAGVGDGGGSSSVPILIAADSEPPPNTAWDGVSAGEMKMHFQLETDSSTVWGRLFLICQGYSGGIEESGKFYYSIPLYDGVAGEPINYEP